RRSLDQVDAVVRPAGDVVAEGVEHADGERGVHPLPDLVGGEPADLLGLVGLDRGAPDRAAAVDERDHPAGHVLVDAGQALDGDLDAGLLRHLAADALLERLTELEHAPGRLPPAVVPSLDHQDAAVVADDDARDGDEVRRGDPVARCRHPGRLRSPAAAACPPSAPGRAGGVRGLRTRAGRSRVRIDGRSTGTGWTTAHTSRGWSPSSTRPGPGGTPPRSPRSSPT